MSDADMLLRIIKRENKQHSLLSQNTMLCCLSSIPLAIERDANAKLDLIRTRIA